MHCPNCGLSLADASAQVCPRCGHPLSMPTHTSEYGHSDSPQGGSTGHDFTSPPAPTSSAPGYFAQPGTPPNEPFYGQAAPPSYPMYAPPGMPPAYPPGYPPYGQYGQGAPVTTPFYGQAAPPSYPLYGQPYGQPVPGAPAWPGMQPQPQPKRGNGLLIGLSIGIAAAVLLVSIAAVAVVYNVRNNASAILAATPTPVVTDTPVQRVLFQDPLTSNKHGYGWSVNDHCFFASDGYHIRNGWGCYAPVGDLANFDISVDAKQISGVNNYPYSLLFRIEDNQHYYFFAVVDTGDWAVFERDNDTATRLINYHRDSAIQRGYNVKNTLRVVGTGSHFQFFINGTAVGEVDNTDYVRGEVGMSAGPNLEAVFTNMKIMSV